LKNTLCLLLSIFLLLCSACTETLDQSEEQEMLTGVLEQARATLQPGTAGSSLKGIHMAAVLLDCCESCAMSEDAITETVSAFLDSLSDADAALFRLQVQQLESCLTTLTEDASGTAEGLLQDCGYSGNGYPWSSSAMDTALLIIQTAR